MLRAQQDNRQARKLIAQALDGGQIGAIVAGPVEHQHIGQLLRRIQLLQRSAAHIDVVRRIAVADQAAQLGQYFFIPGYDGDFHDIPCLFCDNGDMFIGVRG